MEPENMTFVILARQELMRIRMRSRRYYNYGPRVTLITIPMMMVVG